MSCVLWHLQSAPDSIATECLQAFRSIIVTDWAFILVDRTQQEPEEAKASSTVIPWHTVLNLDMQFLAAHEYNFRLDVHNASIDRQHIALHVHTPPLNAPDAAASPTSHGLPANLHATSSSVPGGAHSHAGASAGAVGSGAQHAGPKGQKPDHGPTSNTAAATERLSDVSSSSSASAGREGTQRSHFEDLEYALRQPFWDVKALHAADKGRQRGGGHGGSSGDGEPVPRIHAPNRYLQVGLVDTTVIACGRVGCSGTGARVFAGAPLKAWC